MIGKDTTASTKFEPATFTKNVVQIAEDNQRVLNIILSHDTSQGKKHAGNTLFINDINAHFADVSGRIITVTGSSHKCHNGFMMGTHTLLKSTKLEEK